MIVVAAIAILGCFVPSCTVLLAEAFAHYVPSAPLGRIRIPTRVRIGVDPPAISACASGRSRTTTSTFLQATIKFSGDSSSRLQVNLPIQQQDKEKEKHAATSTAVTSTTTISFGEWLLSSDSDSALLGTANFVQREDGNWDAKQPRIAWFGIDVVPVFVNQIDRRNSQIQQDQQQQDQQLHTPAEVVVHIVNARTDILGKPSGPNQWIANIMKTSTFVGQSRVKAIPVPLVLAVDVVEATAATTTTADTTAKTMTTWDVSVELELTLQIPLPFYVLLPLGFNKIGDRIVQTTCNARTKRFLQDLVTAYQTEQTAQAAVTLE
jgi:hypothetical protein